MGSRWDSPGPGSELSLRRRATSPLARPCSISLRPSFRRPFDDFASAETAERQIAVLTDQLDAVRDVLSAGKGRTRYLQAALATRLDSFNQDRASVAVWSIGVLWRPGAADPQAGWTTSVFDLVWEDDTWKVWAETITSGPAPAPNGGTAPVDAAELDRLLAGYQPWSPVR